MEKLEADIVEKRASLQQMILESLDQMPEVKRLQDITNELEAALSCFPGVDSVEDRPLLASFKEKASEQSATQAAFAPMKQEYDAEVERRLHDLDDRCDAVGVLQNQGQPADPIDILLQAAEEALEEKALVFQLELAQKRKIIQEETKHCHSGVATLERMLEVTRARFEGSEQSEGTLDEEQNDEEWQKALTELAITGELLRGIQDTHLEDKQGTATVLMKLEDDTKHLERIATEKVPTLPDATVANPTGDPVRERALEILGSQETRYWIQDACPIFSGEVSVFEMMKKSDAIIDAVRAIVAHQQKIYERLFFLNCGPIEQAASDRNSIGIPGVRMAKEYINRSFTCHLDDISANRRARSSVLELKCRAIDEKIMRTTRTSWP